MCAMKKGERPFERACGDSLGRSPDRQSVGDAVGFPGTATPSPTARERTTRCLSINRRNMNFREDVNANGLINSVDVVLVKSKVGTALP